MAKRILPNWKTETYKSFKSRLDAAIKAANTKYDVITLDYLIVSLFNRQNFHYRRDLLAKNCVDGELKCYEVDYLVAKENMRVTNLMIDEPKNMALQHYYDAAIAPFYKYYNYDDETVEKRIADSIKIEINKAGMI